MKTLIKNVTLIDSQNIHKKTDCLIVGETIESIGPELQAKADLCIHADHLWLLPGGIDPHTHLDMPLRENICSSDDFFTGTRAAAFGGTTTVLDFPTQSRGESLQKAVDLWHEKAQSKAVIDYGFHVIVTDFNPQTERDMTTLCRDGITSFKFFMAYPGALMMDDKDLFRCFRHCAHIQALPMIHAENGNLIDVFVKEAIEQGKSAPIYHAKTRPALTEAEAIYRAAHIARLAGSGLYIVHLSSKKGLQAIESLRKKGFYIFAETCPQYLFLSEKNYLDPIEGVKFIMSPPLRDQDSPPALLNGLIEEAIQTVGTDHCPFMLEEKLRAQETGFHLVPNGAPGIEHRIVLLYQKMVVEKGQSPVNWVNTYATHAAKLFGLYPKKGDLQVGSDADAILFDPNGKTLINCSTHHMNVDYSLYENQKIGGAIVSVFSKGKRIIHQGEFLGKKGNGKFMKRKPFTDVLS